MSTNHLLWISAKQLRSKYLIRTPWNSRLLIPISSLIFTICLQPWIKSVMRRVRIVRLNLRRERHSRRKASWIQRPPVRQVLQSWTEPLLCLPRGAKRRPLGLVSEYPHFYDLSKTLRRVLQQHPPKRYRISWRNSHIFLAERIHPRLSLSLPEGHPANN